MILALAVAGAARAGSIDGVITDYESGNQGTDITVKTSDGRNHVLWFDNMKKPLFQGKEIAVVSQLSMQWLAKTTRSEQDTRPYLYRQQYGRRPRYPDSNANRAIALVG